MQDGKQYPESKPFLRAQEGLPFFPWLISEPRNTQSHSGHQHRTAAYFTALVWIGTTYKHHQREQFVTHL